MEPVKKSEAPDYYEVIRFPIDLKTMTERLRSRYYVTRKLFVADLQRVIANCREYNPQTASTAAAPAPWRSSSTSSSRRAGSSTSSLTLDRGLHP